MRTPPDLTPNVRDLLVCPHCGRKTLVYAPAGLHAQYLDYECVSPDCHYTLRKRRGSPYSQTLRTFVVGGVLTVFLMLAFRLLLICA